MKFHLKISSDPITNWAESQTAECGAVVPKAVAVFMFDCVLTDWRGFAELFMQNRGACRKCSEISGIGGNYFYGIVNGQEIRTGEE